MPDESTTPNADMADGAVAPFPEGSRIFHIGPPKTGTTALQAACWRARESLLDQGLRYAGGRQHAPAAARAVTGQPTITGNERSVPSIRRWTALVAELDHAREPRVMYSSEALAEADDDGIRRIARDVGPGLRVLVTLRAVDAVIASQWQQSVQAGSTLPIDDWLRWVLGDGDRAPMPGPMRVFRQGDLVRRWADVVGPERVTVIVLDRSDPGFLFRSAEALLALRPGTLQAADDQVNRSLTVPEAEVIRRMNVQSRQAGVANGARSVLVTSGAAAAVKRRPPAPGTAMVRLPAWAAARAVEMGEQAHATITSSGVRLLGDPRSLIPDPPASEGDPGVGGAAVWVDPETAATLAMGVAWGTGLRLGPHQPVGPERLALTFVPTRVLARLIVDRGVARLGRSRKLP